MKDSSISSLIELNKLFYLNNASAFHKTRQHPWNGWTELLPLLPQQSHLTVDIGCGNGRWLQFLKDNEILSKTVIGIDIDAFMLSQARNVFSREAAYSFFQADCVNDLRTTFTQLLKSPVSILTSFGLWHHIPSFDLRLANLTLMAESLEESGVGCISLWQFANDPAYQHKLISPDQAMANYGLEVTDFDDGDYFLGWQHESEALRYCHSFSDAEIETMQNSLSMPSRIVIGSGNDRTNRYLVFGKTL